MASSAKRKKLLKELGRQLEGKWLIIRIAPLAGLYRGLAVHGTRMRVEQFGFGEVGMIKLKQLREATENEVAGYVKERLTRHHRKESSV